MAAKQILVSSDDITYYLLPGSTGEMTREGAAITDTIFGQTYKSEITGPITWGVNANAIYKGYPGYVCTVKKPGTATTMTTEACSLVSGKTYQITSTSKRIISRADTFTVFDNAIDHTADVISVDWLNGKVTFAASYTVTTPVTVTGKYYPMANVGKFTSYTLTQTADAIKNSDMPALQGNGGFDTHIPGLKTVAIDLPSVFAAADGWHASLVARSEYVLEVNPDGTGLTGSLARGFFRLMTDRQSGAVGALEEETLNFRLSVPYTSLPLFTATPFEWIHGGASPIPTAIKKCLEAFEADTTVYVKYLHDGSNGWKGTAVVTNVTLTGGMDSPNSFTANFQGSGAPVVVP